MKVINILVVCMAVMGALLSSQSEAAIKCGQLQGNLLSCLGYLRGGPLPRVCCYGVKAVVASARTVGDRRAACRCMVAAAQAMGGAINYGNAARLPARCGVNIPFKISPNTNCARVG